jgi:hypothetical protein
LPDVPGDSARRDHFPTSIEDRQEHSAWPHAGQSPALSRFRIFIEKAEDMASGSHPKAKQQRQRSCPDVRGFRAFFDLIVFSLFVFVAAGFCQQKNRRNKPLRFYNF